MPRSETGDRSEVFELMRRRHLELGQMAYDRFERVALQNEGEVRSDEVSEEDWIQLENPKGGERWEVRVGRDGMMELRQLFYSGAGNNWQCGTSFYFDVDAAIGAETVEKSVAPTDVDEPYLTDDTYFNGLIEAVDEWPMALFVVTPIEDLVE